MLSGTIWLWIGFNVFVLAMLAFDLGIFHLGKQLGITCFSWLAARLGLASLPPGLSWRQVYGVSWFAGIGFTMSLFITTLAFDDPHLLAIAKVAILTTALLAAAGGWLLLRFLGPSAHRVP
jgi:NhaA family Na+:H+ antiporter